MAKQNETDPQHLRELGEIIESIPIVEEELRLDKREVVTGRVRVRTVSGRVLSPMYAAGERPVSERTAATMPPWYWK